MKKHTFKNLFAWPVFLRSMPGMEQMMNAMMQQPGMKEMQEMMAKMMGQAPQAMADRLTSSLLIRLITDLWSIIYGILIDKTDHSFMKNNGEGEPPRSRCLRLFSTHGESRQKRPKLKVDQK